MKSVFNHKYQHNDLDAKLVLALERLSHVFRLLLWEQTKKHSLSPIQNQILIYIHHLPQFDRNTTTLAQKLNLTKATISDAIKSLEKKRLISKKIDAEDKRYFYLTLTSKGEHLVKKIERWIDGFKRKIEGVSEPNKLILFDTLLNLLISFEKDGVLNRNRICLTCRHLKSSNLKYKTLYFCQLLNHPLKDSEIRLDCQEHEEKSEVD